MAVMVDGVPLFGSVPPLGYFGQTQLWLSVRGHRAGNAAAQILLGYVWSQSDTFTKSAGRSKIKKKNKKLALYHTKITA